MGRHTLRQPGFSLLETLIATGILIIVSAAIVALSNSLIQGTIIAADKTITNRWAAEGLERVAKLRDDNIKSRRYSSDGLPLWLELEVNQILEADQYGWYTLADNGGRWSLTRSPAAPQLQKAQALTTGEALNSDVLVGYRLICIEAVGATGQTDRSDSGDSMIRCNTGEPPNHTVIASDGDRANLGPDCSLEDRFCQMTKPSLNLNRLNQTQIIPAGNAVKVRSVIVWVDKGVYRVANLATLLTNWRGYE